MCVDDTECDPGLSCDPASGLCITTSSLGNVMGGGACQDDADCAPGLLCTDHGVCDTDPNMPGTASGGPCLQDSDCVSGACDVVTDTCL
jgi:hypothetical protein